MIASWIASRITQENQKTAWIYVKNSSTAENQVSRRLTLTLTILIDQKNNY